MMWCIESLDKVRLLAILKALTSLDEAELLLILKAFPPEKIVMHALVGTQEHPSGIRYFLLVLFSVFWYMTGEGITPFDLSRRHVAPL